MSTLQPWQLFVVTVAGWINRHQQDVIDYIIDENRVLKPITVTIRNNRDIQVSHSLPSV